MTATLEFIIGRAGTGKTTACLEAMRQRMAEDPLGPCMVSGEGACSAYYQYGMG